MTSKQSSKLPHALLPSARLSSSRPLFLSSKRWAVETPGCFLREQHPLFVHRVGQYVVHACGCRCGFAVVIVHPANNNTMYLVWPLGVQPAPESCTGPARALLTDWFLLAAD